MYVISTILSTSTVRCFNPGWHDRQYWGQVCGHVHKNKDSEADEAHQGNLSPVDLIVQKIGDDHADKCILLPIIALQLLHKSSVCAQVLMDVNKNSTNKKGKCPIVVIFTVVGTYFSNSDQLVFVK